MILVSICSPKAKGASAAVDLRPVDAGAGGREPDGVGQQVGCGPGGWWGVGACGAVEADDGVEVDQSALLVLGDLGVRDSDGLGEQALRDTGNGGDGAAQVEHEAGPQGRGVGVPQHGAGVVVPLGVERGAEERVALGMGASAAAAGGAARASPVDRAVRGRGEGGEDAGVGGDLVGDVLAAAQAGGDEVVGVPAVELGAGGAAGGAAVAAADQEVSGGQFLGFQFAQDFAGEGVDLGALAFEPDRLGAAAERGQLPYHAEQVLVPGERGQRGCGRFGAGDCGGGVLRWHAGGTSLHCGTHVPWMDGREAPAGARVWRLHALAGDHCEAGPGGGGHAALSRSMWSGRSRTLSPSAHMRSLICQQASVGR